MSSPLQLIKDGIEKQDFDLVVAGYEALTGEDLSSKGKRGRKTKEKKTKIDPKLIVRDTDSEPINLKNLPKVPKHSGPVGGKKKMFSPAAHLYDEDEAAINAAFARKRESREPYKPEWKKCSCGKKFDVKKVYPAGLTEGSEPICSACQNRRIKS
jgi:hypothetical protein